MDDPLIVYRIDVTDTSAPDGKPSRWAAFPPSGSRRVGRGNGQLDIAAPAGSGGSRYRVRSGITGGHMSGLSERDMRILAFERRGWRSPGVKEQAISETLGIPATRYYQLLNELIDKPEALAFDPALVKRLRAQRARRQRIRSPRSKGRPA